MLGSTTYQGIRKPIDQVLVKQSQLFIYLGMANNGSITGLFTGVGLAVLRLWKCAAMTLFNKTKNQ